ncbi:MAG: SDR family NAD(P)-dependent oxidoreductase [Alphaproteobacteria bacterium]
MDLHLAGKAALVAGGSTGIGLAAARRLLAEGARVAIAGRNAERLARAAGELRRDDGVAAGDVAAQAGDVTRPDDAAAMAAAAVAAFGRLDIVVFAVGGELRGDFDALDPAAVAAHLQTRAMGAWMLARAAVPHLRRQGGGRLIVVIGQSAKLPAAGTIAAGMAGAAQHAFVKALSDHLARDNILVTSVCHGHIRAAPGTAMDAPRERWLGRSLEHQEAGWGLDVPLGRAGTPEEVANAVAFLASDRAAFLTGTNLDVDGGDQRMIF